MRASPALLPRRAARQPAARAGALSLGRADRRHAHGAARRTQAGVRVCRQDARVPGRRAARPAARGESRAARRARRVRRAARAASTAACRPFAASQPTTRTRAPAALRNIDELAEYLGPRRQARARAAASLDRAAVRAPRRPCSRGARPQARTASATATCTCRTSCGATARSWRSTRSSSTASCATSTSSARPRSSRWICARTGASDLAYEFLNRYLEVSGDYAGVDVLRFYLVYRALVRAKVAAIKRAQAASATSTTRDRYRRNGARARGARAAAARDHARPFRQRQDVRDRRARQPPARAARSLRPRAQTPARARRHGANRLGRSGPALYAAAASASAPMRRWPRSRTGCCATGRTRSSMRRSCAAPSGSQFRQVAAANAARFAILDCTAPVGRAAAARRRARAARARRVGSRPRRARAPTADAGTSRSRGTAQRRGGRYRETHPLRGARRTPTRPLSAVAPARAAGGP